MTALQPPMPYFGGKRRVAQEVWARLGDVPNYVEPFVGSAAVLLARPDSHAWWDRVETINDADGYVSNFWRALQADPEGVARWADWPVNENDLHARHAWLVGQRDQLWRRLEGDPAWYDAAIAGWWLWGICAWIGGGWCSGKGPWHAQGGELVPDAPAGAGAYRQRPDVGTGRGIHRQHPRLGPGKGIHRPCPGTGEGHCAAWTERLRALTTALADRLRRVTVCSGDWSRVLSPAATTRYGLTGVFLDPPYSATAGRDPRLYAVDDLSVAQAVRRWAIAHGDDPRYRIALCGYEGEHELPAGWARVAWTAQGGYANQGNGANHNGARERIWFSPACLSPQRQEAAQLRLWEIGGA